MSPGLQAKHKTRNIKSRLDVLVAHCGGESGHNSKLRDSPYLWPAQAVF